MPKMKSNRGASKRFRLTGTGKVRRNKAYASHILTKKSTKRKRNLRKAGIVTPADEARVKRMING
jgi:large subunit ribosomal protein L35